MPRAPVSSSALLLALAIISFAVSAKTPVAVFASLPDMDDVRISPDGKYLSFLSHTKGTKVVNVVELGAGLARTVVSSTENRFDVSWCRWANDTRMLCGFRGADTNGINFYPLTRLVGVNADGSKMKVLVQNTTAGGSQFQDDILDWTPDEPDTVLVAIDDDGDIFPSVFELDIYTGRLRIRARQHAPITSFTTDTAGQVRIGCGLRGTRYSCYARDSGKDSWQQLLKYEVFQSDDSIMSPLGFGKNPNKVYASGKYEGRAALWEIDLTDTVEPKLVFSHPAVDIGSPVLQDDGGLRGVRYDTDRPFLYYTDPYSDAVMRAVKAVLPDTFNEIVDETRDHKLMVVRAYSDIEPGRYYLLKVESMGLVPLGASQHGLNPATLGRMQNISYPAKDGTSIPGYLTIPRGVRAENLPLVVMPHGGPIARDSWSYDFLLQFLVDRGYAVLQMNFRGSDGYGDAWFTAAHQDWGGLTYSDIFDGAQWAIKKGIADPKRVCIVGWSFGGYAALLGATRNSDVFRCAVSIAGISDLGAMLWQERNFTNNAVVRRQVGTDSAKLKEDSPARHAADMKIPLLMVHGTHDWQVSADQSRQMASALKRADRPFELVLIKDASHQLEWEADRITLLTALDGFLEKNLGPGVTPPAL